MENNKNIDMSNYYNLLSSSSISVTNNDNINNNTFIINTKFEYLVMLSGIYILIYKNNKLIDYILNKSNKNFNCIAYSENEEILCAGEGNGKNCEISFHAHNANINSNIFKIFSFKAHKYSIEKIKFFNDDKYLISIGDSYDKSIYIWDISFLKNSNLKDNNNNFIPVILYGTKYKSNVYAFDICTFISKNTNTNENILLSYIMFGGDNYFKLWEINHSQNNLNDSDKEATSKNYITNKYNISTGKLGNKVYTSAIFIKDTTNCIKTAFALTLDDSYLIEISLENKIFSRWVNLKAKMSICIAYDTINSRLYCGCSDGILRIFNSNNLVHEHTFKKEQALNSFTESKENYIYPDIIGLKYSNNKLYTLYSNNLIITYEYTDNKNKELVVNKFVLQKGSINNSNCFIDNNYFNNNIDSLYNMYYNYLFNNTDINNNFTNNELIFVFNNNVSNELLNNNFDSNNISIVTCSDYQTLSLYSLKNNTCNLNLSTIICKDVNRDIEFNYNNYFKKYKFNSCNILSKNAENLYSELDNYNKSTNNKNDISSIKLSPCFEYIVCGTNTGKVLIYKIDIQNNTCFKLIHSIESHNNSITTIEYLLILNKASNNNYEEKYYILSTGGEDNYIHLYDFNYIKLNTFNKESKFNEKNLFNVNSIDSHLSKVIGINFTINKDFNKSYKICIISVSYFNAIYMHYYNVLTNDLTIINYTTLFKDSLIKTHNVFLCNNLMYLAHNNKVSLFDINKFCLEKTYEMKKGDKYLDNYLLEIDINKNIMVVANNDNYIRIRNASNGALLLKLNMTESVTSLKLLNKSCNLLVSTIEGNLYYFQLFIKDQLVQESTSLTTSDKNILNSSRLNILEKYLKENINLANNVNIINIFNKLKSQEQLEMNDIKLIESLNLNNIIVSNNSNNNINNEDETLADNIINESEYNNDNNTLLNDTETNDGNKDLIESNFYMTRTKILENKRSINTEHICQSNYNSNSTETKINNTNDKVSLTNSYIKKLAKSSESINDVLNNTEEKKVEQVITTSAYNIELLGKSNTRKNNEINDLKDLLSKMNNNLNNNFSKFENKKLEKPISVEKYNSDKSITINDNNNNYLNKAKSKDKINLSNKNRNKLNNWNTDELNLFVNKKEYNSNDNKQANNININLENISLIEKENESNYKNNNLKNTDNEYDKRIVENLIIDLDNLNKKYNLNNIDKSIIDSYKQDIINQTFKLINPVVYNMLEKILTINK